ncbi:phosphoglycerate kinase [Halocalculus aciditolerans]|uniref:Phosphoglycerate kinase n=1 Tax=Halocalculus aciditolerans TaxID=1383812 RepID=A0A830F4C9_9EURY|nr:phosphoglycerate kinase [Halocalculus aciditolerans]GGL53913.1 phosphoglycerate kinase [Halocalculus aciditolerans]
MPVRTLDDLDVDGAALGVRVDINSPVDADGGLTDDARIRAHRETIAELAERGGRVALLAHQGRPGGDDFARLEAHAERLDELLDAPVSYCDGTFSADARDAVGALDPGEIVVLENTRFYSEEYMEFEPARAAETFLVSRLAPALDAYVSDAFAAAHRSQPSLVGFPERLPAYAGRILERELDVLGSVEDTPEPRVYVVGGAKVPDSIDVAEHALENGLADTVLTTGVVGNVFLLAAGVDIGTASEEFVRDRGYWDEIGRAADLLGRYPDRIDLPVDVAVERDGERVVLSKTDLPPRDGESAMDIGPATVAAYTDYFDAAGTVVLNGPAGVFEHDLFGDGSRDLFTAVADSDAYSIVGGGDTAAAIRKFDVEGFDHVSTGGGAALTILTGGTLPAVDALRR